MDFGARRFRDPTKMAVSHRSMCHGIGHFRASPSRLDRNDELKD
jgi:hypothetical protein